MIFPGAVVQEPLWDTLGDLRWESAAGGRLGFLAVVVDRNVADGVGDLLKTNCLCLSRRIGGMGVIVPDGRIIPLPAAAATGRRRRIACDRREVLLDRLELSRIVPTQMRCQGGR